MYGQNLATFLPYHGVLCWEGSLTMSLIHVIADLVIDTQPSPISHQYIITCLYFPYNQIYSRYLIVMNVAMLPSIWNIFNQALLTTIILNSSSFVTCLYSSIVRSANLPVEVNNGVVYLELGRFCQTEIVNTIIGTQIKGWVQESQSQFEELSSFPHQTDVKVLLDTGSTQFWLADSACSNCAHTKSLCPHLGAPEKKITYMKGFIEGADSYINLCNNRIKFTCVKSAQSIGQIKGEGILGLKSGTVGLNMLFNIVKKRSKQYPQNKIKPQVDGHQKKSEQKGQKFMVERNQIGFELGKFRNNIYLSSSRIIASNKSKLEDTRDLYIRSDENWSFSVEQISFFDSTVIIKQPNPRQNSQQSDMIAYVDTGSSKIVFTGTICPTLFKQIKQKLNIECVYMEDRGIDCNKIIKNLDLQLKLSQVSNNTNMVLRIENNKIIDSMTNRLHILCQTSNKTPNKIILGYPFLRSLSTVFTITNIQHETLSEKKVELQYAIRITEDKNSGNDQYEMTVYRFLLLLYVITVGALGWAAVLLLDFIRRKRSTQIII